MSSKKASQTKTQTRTQEAEDLPLEVEVMNLIARGIRGDKDSERAARHLVRAMNLRDQITVRRAMITLSKMMDDAAFEWKELPCATRPEDLPVIPGEKTDAEAEKIREEVERAGVIAHEVAGAAYKRRYQRALDAVLALSREDAAAEAFIK